MVGNDSNVQETNVNTIKTPTTIASIMKIEEQWAAYARSIDGSI